MILRNAIAAIALLLLAITVGAAVQEPAARPPAFMLAILTAAILFENRRYRMRPTEKRQDLRRTSERFVDPETGKEMTVWIGPAGDRHYLED